MGPLNRSNQGELLLTSGTYKVWGLDPNDNAPDPKSDPNGLLVIADNFGGTSVNHFWIPVTGGLTFPLVHDDSLAYWIRRLDHPDGIGETVTHTSLDKNNVPPVIHDWVPWRIEVDGNFAGLGTTRLDSNGTHERFGIDDQFSAPLDPNSGNWTRLIPVGGTVGNGWLQTEMDQNSPQGWNPLERLVV